MCVRARSIRLPIRKSHIHRYGYKTTLTQMSMSIRKSSHLVSLTRWLYHTIQYSIFMSISSLPQPHINCGHAAFKWRHEFAFKLLIVDSFILSTCIRSLNYNHLELFYDGHLSSHHPKSLFYVSSLQLTEWIISLIRAISYANIHLNDTVIKISVLSSVQLAERERANKNK